MTGMHFTSEPLASYPPFGTGGTLSPAWIEINATAVAHNLRLLRAYAPSSRLCAVLKGNAYGHGLEPMAQICLEQGVDFFGVAQAEEALALRRIVRSLGAGDAQVQILTWIYPPGIDLSSLLRANITLSLSSLAQLDQILASVRRCGVPARLHLKVETGMGRAGLSHQHLQQILPLLADAQSRSEIQVEGVFSHLANADREEPAASELTSQQISQFEECVKSLQEAGFTNLTRHLTASSGIVWQPAAHYDLVRAGISLYGYSPSPDKLRGRQIGLRPVLTLKAQLVSVKRLEVGQAVSYGSTWRAKKPTWIGIVPLGYADGLHREASNHMQVLAGGELYSQVGRVCMDQFMINLGEGEQPALPLGAEVEVIGEHELTSADAWARAAGTINYTILTNLSPRLHRQVVAKSPRWAER